MDEKTLRNFLKQKQLECPSDERFTVRRIEAETGFNHNGIINAVTLDVANDFWYAQAFKGNRKAQALVQALSQETLLRRFDNAFNQQRAESEYQQKTAQVYQEKWEDIRYNSAPHHMFVLACSANMFNGAKVHDLISVGVCGKTARELRELELIGTDATTGLDYIKNVEVHKALHEVKYAFAKMKVGSAQERVARALKKVLNGKVLEP